MKKVLSKLCILVYSFVLLVFFVSVNFASAAGFSDYSDTIKKQGYDQAQNKCNPCPTDNVKYYQLTTGVPFLGANAQKCACVPVDSGIPFFLGGILRFVMGSIATVATIIIIVAGFRWSFSAGNKNIVGESKTMITNSIIGLVLALTCGLMLQVVNPKLLSNEVLSVKSVKVPQTTSSTGKCLNFGDACSNGNYDNLTAHLICRENFQKSGEFTKMVCINDDKSTAVCDKIGKWCDAASGAGSIGRNGMLCAYWADRCVYAVCQKVGDFCTYKKDQNNNENKPNTSKIVCVRKDGDNGVCQPITGNMCSKFGESCNDSNWGNNSTNPPLMCTENFWAAGPSKRNVCINRDAVPESQCKTAGQFCNDENNDESHASMICRGARCMYKTCKQKGDLCSHYFNDKSDSPSIKCVRYGGDDGICE